MVIRRLERGDECVGPKQMDGEFRATRHEHEETPQALREAIPAGLMQLDYRLSGIGVGQLTGGGNLALERLKAPPQIVAESRDRRALLRPFGELCLELSCMRDLPAANMSEDQREAGPSYRFGGDPGDITVDVLPQQIRRKRPNSLQSRTD